MMRLLRVALSVLRRWLPSLRPSEEQARLLAQVDPDDFSVEDVASILGISARGATQVCKIAVRRGDFERVAPESYRLSDCGVG